MDQVSPMEKPLRSDIVESLKALAAGTAHPATSRIERDARMRFTVAQALSQGRLTFHFQPVVRAARPDFPAFFEMLARLTLPDGLLLPAVAFLPAVENGPLGRAIDRLALETALAALARDPGMRLSVNMSPLSIGDPAWIGALETAAGRDRSVAGRLILEITETAALVHSVQTLDFMNRVRGFGCAFALDDFGAGATGFRHFRDFRFDIVKIDGAFVKNVNRSPDARVLIECLVALATHFEMTTVAERVETEAEANCLRGLGVDCLQGYLYGRPSVVAALPEAPARGAQAG